MAAYKLNPGGIKDPEMILPYYTVQLFPKWVAGIILGALWAAILSSADSFLNAATTLLGNDIWFRVIKRGERSKTLLTVIGIGTLLIAWLVPSVIKLFIWALFFLDQYHRYQQWLGLSRPYTLFPREVRIGRAAGHFRSPPCS
ncbi:sodium:solute symporter family transporter [Moorella stamsii]|uniref:sodium:solute symporter family transporter n=1 Tax=Neomoorella stamsii TaxID=1266720 RepID=UPI0009F8916E